MAPAAFAGHGMHEPVWFWQTMVSPHMAGLAAALAARGTDVTYVARQPLSVDRAALGWIVPSLGRARLCLAPDRAAVEALVATAPADSRHICQGLRGNGLVRVAQNAIARRGLTHWVVMETVQERGRLSAFVKRLEYRRLLYRWRHRLAGILATGYRTPDWLAQRGMPPERIFQFAYFLPDGPSADLPLEPPSAPRYRVLFVGMFVELKRLNQLIEALAALRDVADVELCVVGSGPLEAEWRALAERLLPGRFTWLGRLRQDEVAPVMAEADCLVLPSRHDGWGAVISEALMAGTSVICSDRCGAAGVVELSGRGGVFRAGDVAALTRLLEREIAVGRHSSAQRAALARWARCLGAAAGAEYLSEILGWQPGADRPLPPWQAPR